MLFNSYTFIFIFLPVVVAGYWLLGGPARKRAVLWLIAASLFFYGWASPWYLVLVLGSVLFNYLFALSLHSICSGASVRRLGEGGYEKGEAARRAAATKEELETAVPAVQYRSGRPVPKGELETAVPAVQYRSGRPAPVGTSCSSASEKRSGIGWWLLVLGIAVNIAILAVFKYAGFFAKNMEALSRFESFLTRIALPIGISFITFQQVAYLVDVKRGKAGKGGLVEYLFFISFFPRLLQGPITYHDEIVSQLKRVKTSHHGDTETQRSGQSESEQKGNSCRIRTALHDEGPEKEDAEEEAARRAAATAGELETAVPAVQYRSGRPAQGEALRLRFLAVGLTIFVIGLFKKTMIADGVRVFAGPVFSAAAKGQVLTLVEAWGGALAYTFQIYFDFSGYSDMAIGLAYMFGIKVPLNFYSPYRATSIIHFWRRWHMTLCRFLRDYLYIPLGGNRRGQLRSDLNVMIVMVIGGIWHGAGWTFLIWGALHGVYIVVYRLWERTEPRRHGGAEKIIAGTPEPPERFRDSCNGGDECTENKENLRAPANKVPGISVCLTFFAVTVAWVFFRADSVTSALAILKGMAGGNGVALPESYAGYLNRLGGLGDLAASLGVRFEYVACFKGMWQMGWILALMFVVWVLPNTHQIMRESSPAIEIYEKEISDAPLFMRWKANWVWATIVAVIGVLGLLGIQRGTEFLYFQF